MPRIELGPHAPHACILPLYYIPPSLTETSYGETKPVYLYRRNYFVELFMHWTQATTFLPSIIAFWRFGYFLVLEIGL